MSKKTLRVIGAFGLAIATAIAARSATPVAPDIRRVTTMSASRPVLVPLVDDHLLERVTSPSTTPVAEHRVVVRASRSTHRSAVTRAPVTTIRPTPKTIVPVGGGCIGHKMSVAAAHACWDGLLARYPWSQSKAFSVLYCESTGQSNASNGTHWGLFQLDTGPYWDPAENIRIAYEHYYKARGNSWGAWSCA